MKQTTLEEALAAVEQHADTDWKAAAIRVVKGLAARGYTFTTDDVWDALDGLDVATHEPRALGAIMRSLSKQKVIIHTGGYTESQRPECHQRPVKIWRKP